MKLFITSGILLCFSLISTVVTDFDGHKLSDGLSDKIHVSHEIELNKNGLINENALIRVRRTAPFGQRNSRITVNRRRRTRKLRKRPRRLRTRRPRRRKLNFRYRTESEQMPRMWRRERKQKIEEKIPFKAMKIRRKKRVNKNVALMRCCERDSRISPGCYNFCNFEQITKESLISAQFTKKCDKKSVKPLLSCISSDEDHRQCCERKMGTFNAGLCSEVCYLTNGIKPDPKYLPCLDKINDIIMCFKEGFRIKRKQNWSPN